MSPLIYCRTQSADRRLESANFIGYQSWLVTTIARAQLVLNVEMYSVGFWMSKSTIRTDSRNSRNLKSLRLELTDLIYQYLIATCHRDGNNVVENHNKEWQRLTRLIISSLSDSRTKLSSISAEIFSSTWGTSRGFR